MIETMIPLRYKYTDANRGPSERKVPGKFRKVYTVAEMSQKHHEVARLLVLGMTNIAIAERLGVTKMMVSNVRNSPVVKEQMKFLSAKKDAEIINITEQIVKTLPKCVEYLSGTIDDADVSDSLKSRNAFGLLAAGGHGPSKNVNVKGMHAILTSKDIQEIRDQAANIGISNGFVVDDQKESD